jgi:hypothetical protein
MTAPSSLRAPVTSISEDARPVADQGASQANPVWRRRLVDLGPPMVAGLAVRFALAPFLSWAGDDLSWARTASAGVHHLGLYQRLEFPYPPAFGHLLQVLGVILQHLGLPSSSFAAFSSGMSQQFSLYVTSPAFNVAFKTLLFAFDLATAFLLLGLVRQLTGDDRKARRAFCWWFLNPLVIVESAVMGAFDVVAGFFILAALYCTLTRRNRLLGVVLALGVLTKLSPAFVAPMLVAAAIVLARRDRPVHGARRRVLAKILVGAGATCVVVLLPELITGSLGTMLHATFSRQQVGAYFGGFSLFGLSSFPGLGWIATVTTSGIAYVRMVVYIAEAALVAWSVVRTSRDPGARSLLSTAVVLLSAVLIIGPLTQPQYLLWLMPVLIALTVAYGGPRWAPWVLGAAAIPFILMILGPYALAGPLARFTHLLSQQVVSGHVEAWLVSGPGTSTFQTLAYARGSVVVVGLVALVALIIHWARTRTPAAGVAAAVPGEASRYDSVPQPHEPEAVPGPNAAPRRMSGTRLAALTVLAAATVTLVGSLLAAAATLQRTEPAAALTSASGNAKGLDVRLALRLATGQRQVRLVAFPTRPATPIRRIYLYYDPRYPYAGTDQRTQLGVVDHLRAEMSLRSAKVPVRTLGAAGLASVLRNQTSATSTAIVDTSGVFPDSVFANDADLVTPWLLRGGTMVWGGSPLGWYSSATGSKPPFRSPPSVGALGAERILGPGFASLAGQPSRIATIATPYGTAMGITYQPTSVGVPPLVAELRGGATLGWVGAGYSSVTAVPVGHGTVLIFGGSVYDEEDLVRDTVAILSTRGYALDGRVASRQLSAGQVRANGGSVAWRVDPSALGAAPGGSLSIAEVDPDPAGVMLSSQSVNLAKGP